MRVRADSPGNGIDTEKGSADEKELDVERIAGILYVEKSS